MTTTIPAAITVRNIIGRHDLGAPGPSGDAAWSEICRAACESEIETVLARLYPEAELDITVIVGDRSSCGVEATDERGRSLDAMLVDAIAQRVREASNDGFDRACSNG